MPLSNLPVNARDLLYCRGVESERVEFKASWDAATTGAQVLRTICAFANDYHNLNGGYVVIGVAERDGHGAVPPQGLSAEDADAAQKWIRGNCNRLDPPYAPIFSPELVEGRLVLVVWAPASDTRPHRAPADAAKGKHAQGGAPRYWVRLGSETVDAERRGSMLRGLIDQTARVPWDDRPARTARVEDMREAKVREFLHDVRSGLLEQPDVREIYRRLRLVTRINGDDVPRNIGLLCFSNDPAEWFPCAKIEVVQFPADRAGDVQEERVFRGSLLDQARDCLAHLENLSVMHLQKQPDNIYARTWSAYPIAALREALMNAIYHRSYDIDQLEPIKIYIFPDRVEVISYPGPVAGIEPAHLLPGAKASYVVQARNRRIGELLKELELAEGRLSGLPKIYAAMDQNGSPPPRFDFDEERTYFQATFPTHPQYGALSAVRDAAHLRTVGKRRDASRRLEDALVENRTSQDAPQVLRELAATRMDEDGAAPSLAWGVDSCKGGWFYIALDATGEWCCGMVERLHTIVERAGKHDRFLVDIPIGLPDNENPEPRACDLLARSTLGKGRSSSVFSAPVREALLFDLDDASGLTHRQLRDRYYRGASNINKTVTRARAKGRGSVGISLQTFALIPKVREVDELLRHGGKTQKVIQEVHPELCFWALNGMRPMKHNKKRPEGHEERLAVLGKCWLRTKAVAKEVSGLYSRKEVALDDIADAMAATLTARADEQNSLPEPVPLDGEGLPMQMVWAPREAIRFRKR